MGGQRHRPVLADFPGFDPIASGQRPVRAGLGAGRSGAFGPGHGTASAASFWLVAEGRVFGIARVSASQATVLPVVESST